MQRPMEPAQQLNLVLPDRSDPGFSAENSRVLYRNLICVEYCSCGSSVGRT